jgi:hypothetical protein
MATSKHLPSAAKRRFIRGLASMINGRTGLQKTGLLGVCTLNEFGLLVLMLVVGTPSDFCPEGTQGLSLGF